MGPVILCISGRFDILEYMDWRYPMMGFNIFCLYMRWFLTPMALLTWANLNHTLCGTDTDPFFVILDLGKWYWPASEIYLGSLTAFYFIVNSLICYIVKRVICGDKSSVIKDSGVSKSAKTK